MLQTPKNRFATYLGALLLLLLSGNILAGQVHTYRAEPLRLDSNRLYLWLDSPIIPTADFTLTVSQNGRLLYKDRIGGILERVVVSQVLPEDVVSKLRNSNDCTAEIYLDSDQLSDSLIIALPSNLRQLWLDTLLIENTQMPIRYSFRYFDDFRELEIAARLQQVDLLVLPDIALPDSKLLADSPYILEWNLVGIGIKDDLLATAMNYCLRGLFADSNASDYSSFILPSHIESIFPQNTSHARELFAQSKKNKDKLACTFPGFKMYPALTDRINMALSECSSGKFTFREDDDQASTLQFFPFFAGEDSNSVLLRSWREVVLPLRSLIQRESDSSLDSCLLGTSTNSICRELVSRKLAESARFVPLGRTWLAIQKFEHVRYLDDHSNSAQLSNFYTIKR